MPITQAFRTDIAGPYVYMPWEHSLIHKGLLFSFTDTDLDVDISSPKYYHFKTSDADAKAHLVFNIGCDGAATIEFFENPTTSADGTEITAYNFNRTSANVPTILTAYYDPTASADGTRLRLFSIGTNGGTPLTTSGGEVDHKNEIILKSSESYLLKITVAADNSRVDFQGDFYEYDYNELIT